MAFHKLDLNTWERREHFAAYSGATACTYSMTADVDITGLPEAARRRGAPFHAVLVYLFSRIVNAHRELRMAADEDGAPGWHDVMHPSYTVFHPDDETFSCLWTEYDEDFDAFLANWRSDAAQYGEQHGFCVKPPVSNCFNFSCIPWVSFTGMNLNLSADRSYYPPIFTVGKYHISGGRCLLPLAVQVHHAVCDGFHAARIFSDLETLAHTF